MTKLFDQKWKLFVSGNFHLSFSGQPIAHSLFTL